MAPFSTATRTKSSKINQVCRLNRIKIIQERGYVRVCKHERVNCAVCVIEQPSKKGSRKINKFLPFNTATTVVMEPDIVMQPGNHGQDGQCKNIPRSLLTIQSLYHTTQSYVLINLLCFLSIAHLPNTNIHTRTLYMIQMPDLCSRRRRYYMHN